MRNYKRRHFFIDKEYQGRYIFRAFMSIVFGSIIFALIFAFFSSNTLSIVYENYHLKLGTTPGLLLNRIFSTQWLFIILGGISIAVLALFLSHRVAGPFFRFEKTLEKMKDGDFSERIRLRKNDEGKRLAEMINGFNDRMGTNFVQVLRNSEAIQDCCDTLKAPEELPPEELQKIQELNQTNLEILSKLKL